LAEFEVRETLYMLRGSYGSVLSERRAQGAEILLFFAGFGASNEGVRAFSACGSFEAQTGRDSREILFYLEPRWADFAGDPL
jgi:hypothetical protein